MYTYLGIQKSEDILESGAKDVCKFSSLSTSTFDLLRFDENLWCSLLQEKNKIDNKEKKNCKI